MKVPRCCGSVTKRYNAVKTPTAKDTNLFPRRNSRTDVDARMESLSPPVLQASPIRPHAASQPLRSHVRLALFPPAPALYLKGCRRGWACELGSRTVRHPRLCWLDTPAAQLVQATRSRLNSNSAKLGSTRLGWGFTGGACSSGLSITTVDASRTSRCRREAEMP